MIRLGDLIECDRLHVAHRGMQLCWLGGPSNPAPPIFGRVVEINPAKGVYCTPAPDDQWAHYGRFLAPWEHVREVR